MGILKKLCRKIESGRWIAITGLLVVTWGLVAFIGVTNGRAEIYGKVVELICSNERSAYIVSRQLMESLPDRYRDIENIGAYLEILMQYDKTDRTQYKQVLRQLEEISEFEDDRMNHHYTTFQNDVENLQEEYQQDKAAAKILIDEINTLPSDVSKILLTDKTKIEKIRADYEKCSKNVQTLVTNFNCLSDAEAQIQMLERANQVIGQINAIGTVTVDSQQKIDDAQKAYDALSDEEKKYVTNYAVLDKAKVQLTVLQEAQAVIDKINAIGNVTLSSEDDIRAARSAYDLLSDDAKSHVNNIDKLKRAENNFESLRNSSGDTEPDDDAASNYGTFYWVPSGKVYHTTRDCPTLSRSKTIRSGSVPPSGRHICKVCS